MTHTTNARTAGVTFLVYFAAVMLPVAGVGDAHTRVLFGLVTQFSALVLGVTLYGMTREQDVDLAMLGLTCRVAEGIIGASLMPLSLAMTFGATSPPFADVVTAIAPWNTALSALFFAVGSTAFCWLLLRGRLIPTALAWLGVVASALMVFSIPFQLAGLTTHNLMAITSLPIVLFELPLGVWLMTTGGTPRPSRPI